MKLKDVRRVRDLDDEIRNLNKGMASISEINPESLVYIRYLNHKQEDSLRIRPKVILDIMMNRREEAYEELKALGVEK